MEAEKKENKFGIIRVHDFSVSKNINVFFPVSSFFFGLKLSTFFVLIFKTTKVMIVGVTHMYVGT